MFEQDYIMRLIKEMVRALVKLLFGIDTQTPTAELLQDAEQKQTMEELYDLVDAGEIKTGMPKDAVYIAWGKPDDITYSEDSHGKLETWLYYGRYMKEYRYWNYRAINRGDGEEYLVRHLESDYNPESFLKAELIFSRGKLISCRTYPTPQTKTDQFFSLDPALPATRQPAPDNLQWSYRVVRLF